MSLNSGLSFTEEDTVGLVLICGLEKLLTRFSVFIPLWTNERERKKENRKEEGREEGSEQEGVKKRERGVEGRKEKSYLVVSW